MKTRIAATLVLLTLAACVVPPPTTAPRVPTAAPTVASTTPPTATPPAATALPATAAASALQPLSPDECAALAGEMAKVLGVEVTQAEVPFNDPATGKTGTACQAKATGTGEQFQSPQAAVDALAGVLKGQGWVEDMKLAAGGATGTASGFRKDDQVCVAGAVWQPSPDAKCRQDRPISTCEVAPEQQLYTVTLDCAQG